MTTRPVRLDARSRYSVAGEPGVWRYVGQASYVDDDGRVVEHHYVRMVAGDREVWVDPGTVATLPMRLATEGDVA